MSEESALFLIPEEEIDLHVEEDDDANFIARVLHKPTMTLKISDWWPSRDEAVKQAMEDLTELIDKRRQGFGSR